MLMDAICERRPTVCRSVLLMALWGMTTAESLAIILMTAVVTMRSLSDRVAAFLGALGVSALTVVLARLLVR